jgi:hypothetical protein
MFRKALIEGDFEEARKQYERKSGDKFLTRRNKATLDEIAKIEQEASSRIG